MPWNPYFRRPFLLATSGLIGYVYMCSGIVWWNAESKKAIFWVSGSCLTQLWTMERAGALCLNPIQQTLPEYCNSYGTYNGARSVNVSRRWNAFVEITTGFL